MVDKTELLLRYGESRDENLRNEIVLLYMDMVRQVAFHLRNLYAKGYDVDDLINEGVIGLIAAVETFDAARGVKFETYATLKIKGAIIDYIRAQDRVPRRVRRFGREMESAFGELCNSLGRTPTNEELAEHMGMTREQFAKTLADTAGANTLSFEELLYEDNLAGFGDNAAYADGRLYSREQTQVIAQAVAALKPRERQVVSLYYYENLKMSEIAEVLGVTEGRVCQIHSKCMLKLRAALQEYINNK